MTALNERALLPCPFCGGEPVMLDTLEVKDNFVRGTSISCDECAIEVHGEYSTDAIEAWNKRAPHASDDAVAVERARCAQMARMHAHHALWAGVAPYGTYGADTDDKTLENFGRVLAARIADRIAAETHDELGDRLLAEGKITREQFDRARSQP